MSKEKKTVKADSRGRVNIGTEYADKRVTVTIEEAREQCQHPNCTNPAVGIYEGIVEPADTIRYAACEEHAPDAKPVEELETNPDS